MSIATELLRDLRDYRAVLQGISTAQLPASVIGLSAVHKAQWTLALFEDLHRPILLLTADEAEATRLCQDINAMAGEAVARVYPMRDLQLGQVAGASAEYEQRRLGILSAAAAGEAKIVCASTQAAAQFTVPPKVLRERMFTLSTADQIEPAELVKKLLAAGYVRRTRTEGAGQFAARGGIVDFFPPQLPQPVRVEFWGDEIDSLSLFDPQTQRRTDPLDKVEITPAKEVLFDSPEVLTNALRELAETFPAASLTEKNLRREIDAAAEGLPINTDAFLPLAYEKKSTLFEHLGNPLVIQSERADARSSLDGADKLWLEDCKLFTEQGVLYFDPWDYRLNAAAFYRKADRYDTVFVGTFARTTRRKLGTLRQVTALAHAGFGGDMSLLKEDLSGLCDEGYRCVVMAGEEKAAAVLAGDLQSAGISTVTHTGGKLPQKGQVLVTAGGISGGFTYPENKTALFTTVRGESSRKRRRKPKRKKEEIVRSLADLQVGDPVVHSAHGIGRFEGVQKLELHGIVKDYLKIRYAGADVLYLPVTQLDLISRYIGPKDDNSIKLNKLNSGEWKRTRQSAKRAVDDMAKELIQLYAERAQQKGYAFSPDSEWQREFEERFPYEETDDQLRCIDEIKKDMEKPVPMERLLCGDVGFGKTEVALRAAFKAILDGKQVALLCPTTILAWQHYQTALERMGEFPINIALLSRFVSPKEQQETVRKLRRGEIDFVIGTHRLVQKDITFKNLGLAIIDEEQRFGVAHKERFKEMFRGVDMLQLSATPIPRTLNMAMSGIRDISLLEDPPLDRLPVQTYVTEYDLTMLVDAIKRELRRDGQVYYIHNRIESITLCASALQQRLPNARIAVAHGQMSEQEISSVWKQMVDHEVDVLVCTTLIETGVDVPNCNTLIVENADRMGLSQLYQLRGRVGRSSRRAFAFFTFRGGKALSEEAAKRLTAIREFTQFGSGFRIALRDLEIRGAGNILGAKQHGHMEAVGYDMYLRLLSQAVDEQQGKPKQPDKSECLIDLQIDAHIPEAYIADLQSRLEIYRKIAAVENAEDAMDVTDELIDRFGEPPKSVQGLLDVSLLRNTAAAMGFTEISQKGNTLYLYTPSLQPDTVQQIIQKTEKGQVQIGTADREYLAIRIEKPETPLSTLKQVLC